MTKYLSLIMSLIAASPLLLAWSDAEPYYVVGDPILAEHLNQFEFDVCNGEEENGSTFKFADNYHEANGGQETVTVLVIAAAWCSGCISEIEPLASLEDSFADDERVRFVYTLYDPGQPYSCAQWANMFSYEDAEKEAFIITENSVNIASWFYNDELNTISYPQHAILTSDMVVHYKSPYVPGAADIQAALNVQTEVLGCTDSDAENYNPEATADDGSCTYEVVLGCTDLEAINYNPEATLLDNTCMYAHTEFDNSTKILQSCVHNPTESEISSGGLSFCLQNGGCIGGYKQLSLVDSCTVVNHSGEYSGSLYQADIGDLNHPESVILKGNLTFYGGSNEIVEEVMKVTHYIVHLPEVESCEESDCSQGEQGDMNNDGNINIVDVVLLVNQALAD